MVCPSISLVPGTINVSASQLISKIQTSPERREVRACFKRPRALRPRTRAARRFTVPCPPALQRSPPFRSRPSSPLVLPATSFFSSSHARSPPPVSFRGRGHGGIGPPLPPTSSSSHRATSSTSGGMSFTRRLPTATSLVIGILVGLVFANVSAREQGRGEETE